MLMPLLVEIFAAGPMLGQAPHEIVPPVNYSLLPRWLVFISSFIALAVIGLLAWWITQKSRRALPPKLPRTLALEELDRIRNDIDLIDPYEFSITVSDILRQFVTDQYSLPLTRQTSFEFLEQLARNSAFSGNERMLLGDFLNRCDLIKFARYQATAADSRLLLDEAVRFVKGETFATVS